MTTELDTPPATAPESSPCGPLGGLIRRAILRAAERRSLDQLAQLDDRLLRDVGLTRADVRALTRGL